MPPINESSFAKAPRSADFSPQHAPDVSLVLQNKPRPRRSRIQDLLNETTSNDKINASRCGSADQLDIPSSTNTTMPNLPTSLPSIADQNDRRILTSRILSSGRGGPLPRLIDPPGGTIGAEYSLQKLPPLSADALLADLPHANSYSTRSGLAYSAIANLSQVHAKRKRRPSDGGPQPPTSQSNSPSIPRPSSFSHPHTEPNLGSSMPRPKASYSPVINAAREKYQLMTLDTDHGPIQVPVEVQGASKVADEKRKRNATASHRFRQRRKDIIAKLELQLRATTEERDSYQEQAAYFSTVACSTSGQAHAKDSETTNKIAKLEHQLSEMTEERDFYQKQAAHFGIVPCSTSGQAHATREMRMTSLHTPATTSQCQTAPMFWRTG